VETKEATAFSGLRNGGLFLFAATRKRFDRIRQDEAWSVTTDHKICGKRYAKLANKFEYCFAASDGAGLIQVDPQLPTKSRADAGLPKPERTVRQHLLGGRSQPFGGWSFNRQSF